MKILVPCKRVPDTDHKFRVQDDEARIDLSNVPFVINPFDAIAVEESLRIRENSSSDVETVVVGIGTEEHEKELRTTLAMGANRAILIVCDQDLDPWNVSTILMAIVEREAPDLVLMGKQAVDDDSNQTGQFLAARLDWPQATFASNIELLDSAMRVARETDTGIETVHVPLPAVVTTDLRLNEPRYASLPSILKAKKKTIEQVSYHELNVSIEPRIQIHQMVQSSSDRTCAKVSNAVELIERLRDEAKVI